MRPLRTIAVLAAAISISSCGSTTSPGSSPTSSGEPAPTIPVTSGPDTSSPDTSTPSTSPPETTTPSSDDTADVDLSELVDRDWKVDSHLTVGGPQPVPTASTASLRFTVDDGDEPDSDAEAPTAQRTGTVSVDAGCNTGSAEVTYSSGNELTVGPIALTLKLCADDDLNALETIIVSSLGHEQSWTVDGDRLYLTPLTVSDTGLQLHDAASSPGDDIIPGRTAEDTERLLGTTWIPERFITVGPLDPIPADSGASLRFEGIDRVAVHTGCNQGSGTVSFTKDGSFTIDDLTMTEIACDDGGLEGRILAQLAHPLQWGLDGDTLSVFPLDVSDTGIIFRDAAAIAAIPTTTVSAEEAAAADRADVIAAAALARVTVDNSFGGQSTFAEVAIVELLGQPGDGGQVVGAAEGVALTAAEKARIEDALAPIAVRWTDDAQDPIVLAAQAAGQLSAIVTLSEPALDGDTASIVSGLFCGSTCGIGGEYTLERQADGSWIVTDQPGGQWIS